MAGPVSVASSVEIIPYGVVLAQAGWCQRADPDTNLDRLREFLFETQTHYYQGQPGIPVDSTVAQAEAAGIGCHRVTFFGS